ncbi:MAG TPA: FAD-dependent oxidoreductase [Solirubrobacteraceae bacterium]|jgi:glycine/D-amino acid oxidase-like deaminating enzyme
MRHDAYGYWFAEAPAAKPAPALAGTERADVAIVGGGFAGMWTAWALRKAAPDLRIVLLEAAQVGQGPSGRNAGFLNAMWHRLGSLAQHFGDAAAWAIAELAGASVEEIGAWAAAREADVWFRRAGHLEVATSVAQEGRWMPSVEACRRLGAGAQYLPLDAEQVRLRCESPAFGSGALMPQAATVQPARLALALRAALIEEGVSVYEHTRVRSLHAGRTGVVLEAGGGSVAAASAVVAINAAAAGLLPLRNGLTVSSTHMLVTEPVPDVLEAIGWTGGECISDGRNYVHYFRTTPDGRIAFGFGGGRLAFGARLGGHVAVDPRVLARVRADLLQIFPTLAGRRIEHGWGGPVDVSPNKLPVIGTIGRDRVHYVYGFTGNGVGPSHLAGKVLASLVLDRRDELTRLALVEPQLARVPPEPLRYLGGAVVRRALLRKEDREDAGLDVGPLNRFIVDMPRRLGIHIGR